MMIPRLTRFFCYTVPLLFLFSFASKSSFHSSAHPSLHPSAEASFHSSAGMENEILRLVNRHRRSMGLKPLQMNGVESSVAAQHSRDMASGRAEFGHTGAKSREKAISRQIGPVLSMGENVAYGERSAKEVVNDWLNSPGHRRNIEGNFKLTGIGLARDRQGTIYYTQIFTR
ncbi:MAG TPA: CAP domain-containing protein [Puia sp.]|nr:CAP domain-containing protein [Puia sp.]